VVREPTNRASSVTTIATGAVDPDELARRCREQLGVTLGTGIGDLSETSFRIGHMGHVNAPMVLGVLGAVEAALIAMNAPVAGSGIAAAAQLIGDALA
jgi:alanine-glyoxylate transaminase/serine-glyoxylate transaminase/serine-pyruvate transaminase